MEGLNSRLQDWIDLKQVTTRLVEFLPQLVAAVLVMLAFLALFRVIRRPLRAILEKTGFHEALVHLLVDNIIRYAMIVVALVMAADQLGINVAAALAGIGIAGIAVGFAAQDSVANVFSGILIFFDKPFLVGDWIEAEGQFGCVSEITLRSTRIRTPRNTYVVIPNKKIIDAVLENYSKHGELRVDVPVGIAYKENIPQAREVLLEAIQGLPHVKQDPAPDVVALELGDSSVNLSVRVWIDQGSHQQATYAQVVEASKLALDAADIQIPFPHLQLFVDQVEDRVWNKAAGLVQR